MDNMRSTVVSTLAIFDAQVCNTLEHCVPINFDRFTDSGPLVEGCHSCAAISHPKSKWLMKDVDDEISS